MIIDLNRYGINRTYIKNHYSRYGGDPARSVSVVAASIGCPILALAYYLAEEIGFTPELIKTIQTQRDFGFRILNGPANDPFRP